MVFVSSPENLGPSLNGPCRNALIPMDVTSECLAAMAHICRGLLVKPSLRSRVTRDDTLMLLLRVMTGVIILYDHIDPYGVFRKTSKLDVS
ncbi:unnamed protein product [Rodentolepis nana]|uniref:CYRIA-B_Rac1-bd domain-containing protein n=1 Tax=Rodentolepis nana TaxID=102285 RepID=A0A0R3TYA0_RODNA|nr:unnamed protein product [Rodentolepis nana]